MWACWHGRRMRRQRPWLMSRDACSRAVVCRAHTRQSGSNARAPATMQQSLQTADDSVALAATVTARRMGQTSRPATWGETKPSIHPLGS